MRMINTADQMRVDPIAMRTFYFAAWPIPYNYVVMLPCPRPIRKVTLNHLSYLNALHFSLSSGMCFLNLHIFLSLRFKVVETWCVLFCNLVLP